jgi:hypothetical protein
MIICHIVGICNKLKINFINDVKNISNISNIFILDIDEISKKIISSEEYNSLTKSKIPNNIIKLGYYWKEKLLDEINILLEHHKNDIVILIGLITFYLDNRIRINFEFDIGEKLFLNTNIDIYVSCVLEHNIDNYKDDIISGKFPLQYLDRDIIKSQRENLKESYMTKDYKLKTYEQIIKFIEFKIKNINNSDIKPVYIASYKRFEDKINYNSDNVIGYTDKWMALLDILPKNNINKNIKIKDNKINVQLKESALYGFNDLNKCCYIYQIYPTKKIDKYRYIIDDFNFINRYYVSNIKNELKTDNIDVDFIDFNFE